MSKPKAKNFKYFLIVLIWIIGILDIAMAWRYHSFLELNPIFQSFGFGTLVIMKIALMCFLTYLLSKNYWKTERVLFLYSANFMLIFLLWGYGAFTGLVGSAQYDQLEGEVIKQFEEQIQIIENRPATSEEIAEQKITLREDIAEETKSVAISEYSRAILTYGLYPLVFSFFSFVIYEKLLFTAIIKRRKQKQWTKEN